MSKSNIKLIPKKLLSASCLATLFSLYMPFVVYANPEDGVVSAGEATISHSENRTDIHQTSDKAVIDWRRFDISPNETTQFHQPSTNSITLNRVNSHYASHINGQLKANGNIIIVNQNGILFGNNAKVDVNGIIATTADIDNDKFMSNSGHLKFDKPGKIDASIINNGSITAKEAGLVGLIAPKLVNNGVIIANSGQIQLASGDNFTIDMYGDKLVEVSVSQELKEQLIYNKGLIEADGGKIIITAAAGKEIINNLIVIEGELKAPAVTEKNGEIIIYAEGSNAVKNNIATDKGIKKGNSEIRVAGKIDASGQKPGERGGKVTITADNVALLDGTFIDGRGYDGLSGTTVGKEKSAPRIGAAGGDIQIGGDYLGQGNTPAALNLYVDKGSLILNDAINSGDAGRTIFWSDDTTDFYGNVYARALGGKRVNKETWNANEGGNSGDGGFVETSGHKQLEAHGYVDITASNGETGTYLLDPANIAIYGNFDPKFASTDGTINLAPNLKLWLDANDVDTSDITYVGGLPYLNGWPDLSGNSNDAISPSLSKYPRWIVNSQNGKATALFDGTNDGFNVNLSFLNDASFGYNGIPHTNIFTAKTTAYGSFYYNSASGGGVYEGFETGPKYRMDYMLGGDTLDNMGVNYGSQTPSAAFGSSGYNVLTFKWLPDSGSERGNTKYIYANTNLELTSTPAGTIGPHTGTDFIGGNTGAYWGGNMAEIIMYNANLSNDSIILLNQYQSAKWNIPLSPPGPGTSEAYKAMASAGGYSVFTTDYLARLSNSADIYLQASSNITLDFQEATLSLASDRNFNIRSGGSILSLSNGAIQTTRSTSGGNISITAGGTLDIANLSMQANNGGTISLSSGNSGSGSGIKFNPNLVANAGVKINYYNAPSGAEVPLSITGGTAANKVYDATTASSFLTRPSITSPATLTGTPVLTFADKNVGTGKTLSLSGLAIEILNADGVPPTPAIYRYTKAADYTANISPTNLSVSGLSATNKVYDGTTADTISGTPVVSPLGSDIVTISGTPIGTFNNKNVGTNKPVTISGLSLTGTDANNYSLVEPSSLTANITRAPLTVRVHNQTITYGTTPILTYSYSGLVGSDTSASFSGSLSAGTGIGTSTIGENTLSADGNYIIADYIPGTITIEAPKSIIPSSVYTSLNNISSSNATNLTDIGFFSNNTFNNNLSDISIEYEGGLGLELNNDSKKKE